MKRILLVLFTISASLMFNPAKAQFCNTGVCSCNAGPNTQLGFPYPDSIPCAVQGQAYSYSIPIKMYSVFNFLGQHYIDSITIDTIYNLPCGLCYQMSSATNTFDSGQIGCIKISGTTNDAVGQYLLKLVITAYLSGNPTESVETIYPPLVYASGIREWFRVSPAPGTNCTATDTLQADSAAKNLTASVVCPQAGINEVAANVASLNIMPNPFNSSAQLSFMAEKNATYAVKITDITGKLVSVKQMQANPGVNTTIIERGNLSAGLYLISLSDGVSSVTRKFTITE